MNKVAANPRLMMKGVTEAAMVLRAGRGGSTATGDAADALVRDRHDPAPNRDAQIRPPHFAKQGCGLL